MNIEREKIDFDVLFVGGGPASLAGAIRLMQLAKEKNITLEVALIEKGAEIGTIHANNQEKLEQAHEEILSAMTISDQPAERLPNFYGVIQ